MRFVPNAKIAFQRKIAWLLFFSFFSLCLVGWVIYFNLSDRPLAFLLIGANILTFIFIFILLVRLNEDILLRKQAEGRLKENQAWLQSILDNTTSLMYIKDPEGRYVMVNRRFREMLHIGDIELIGLTDFDLGDAEAADHYKMLDDEVIRTGKSLEIEEV